MCMAHEFYESSEFTKLLERFPLDYPFKVWLADQTKLDAAVDWALEQFGDSAVYKTGSNVETLRYCYDPVDCVWLRSFFHFRFKTQEHAALFRLFWG